MSEPADDGRWWELWERLGEVPETAIGEIVDGESDQMHASGQL